MTFGKILQKAARLASEHAVMAARVTEAMRDRYGTTHSDVDCDPLIDALDYGGEAPTVAQADAWMAACGAPRLSARTHAADRTEHEG